MTRDELLDVIEASRPVTLCMADGKEHEVPHRDHIAFFPSGKTIIVFDDAERFKRLPLHQITAVLGLEPTMA